MAAARTTALDVGGEARLVGQRAPRREVRLRGATGLDGADEGARDGEDPEPAPEDDDAAELRCGAPDGSLQSTAALKALRGRTILEDSLHVEGAEVDSLSAPSSLHTVAGALLIGPNTALRTLDRLGALVQVDPLLTVQNIFGLSDASALACLQSAARLLVFGSDALARLPVAGQVDTLELHSLAALEAAPSVRVATQLLLVGRPALGA